MQTSTTRAIENLTKSFKTFSRPTDAMVEEIAHLKMEEYPFTVVTEGPKRKNNKFCKVVWTLSFPWKSEKFRDQPCDFPTEADARAAESAYLAQHAATLKCRNALLLDSLRVSAKSELWEAYKRKVGRQAEAVARVTRADALKDLSRM